MSSRGYIAGDEVSEAVVVTGLEMDDLFSFGGKNYSFAADHRTVIQVEVKAEPGGGYSIVRQCGTLDDGIFVAAFRTKSITKLGKVKAAGSGSGSDTFTTKTGAKVGYNPYAVEAAGLTTEQVEAGMRQRVAEADIKHPNTPLSNASDALNRAGDTVGNFVTGVGNTVGNIVNGIAKGAENTWNVILIVGGVVAFVAVNNLTKTSK